MKRTMTSSDRQFPCREFWMGADGIRHLCRRHVPDTGSCVCPCGQTRTPEEREHHHVTRKERQRWQAR
jgi:hypothetical protein